MVTDVMISCGGDTQAAWYPSHPLIVNFCLIFSDSSASAVTPDAALAQLVSSYSLYERCLLRPAAAAASRDRADSLAGRVAALAARDGGATLLPSDWWYAPLVRLYERNNPQR